MDEIKLMLNEILDNQAIIYAKIIQMENKQNKISSSLSVSSAKKDLETLRKLYYQNNIK